MSAASKIEAVAPSGSTTAQRCNTATYVVLHQLHLLPRMGKVYCRLYSVAPYTVLCVCIVVTAASSVTLGMMQWLAATGHLPCSVAFFTVGQGSASLAALQRLPGGSEQSPGRCQGGGRQPVDGAAAAGAGQCAGSPGRCSCSTYSDERCDG